MSNIQCFNVKIVTNPEPGDIVAQQRGYGDASGHVGIIVDMAYAFVWLRTLKWSGLFRQVEGEAKIVSDWFLPSLKPYRPAYL